MRPARSPLLGFARDPRALRLSVAALAFLLATGLRAQTVPALTGRVVDNADILSPDTEAVLTARLKALEDSSSTQVAVLTVPSLGGAVLEQYATQVFRAWGLGQAERDNGVLLLISRDDRQLRIEVGYGLEGDLTDARAASIIRNEIVPRFRAGDYDAGVLAGVDAIVGSVEGTYEPSAFASLPVAGGADSGWGNALFSLVLFGFVPMGLGFAARNTRVVLRYLAFVATWMFVFVAAAHFWAPGIPSPWNPWAGILLLLGYPLAFIALDLWLTYSVAGREKRAHARRKSEAIRTARRKGRTSVVVDGVTYAVPTYSSGDSSGGSYSGGSSFSGGGGSSGGGGASGGW